MPIQILPARLANQIAAGEVVERPASVVKELIENSLDAGATRIEIDIEKGGAKCIRIKDNGKGVCKDQLTLALSRHATSKISHLDDLEAIVSLGFRGEALASISSVSRLTFTSKPADQDQGWQAIAEGRDMDVNIQPVGHPQGTTVEVLDLFFNTPARRRFLKTEKTEFQHIDELIRRIALSSFDIAFVLKHNGKVIRQYRVAETEPQREKRLSSICSDNFVKSALSFEGENNNLKISGWISDRLSPRTLGDVQYCYINGRMIRDKLVNHAIKQAYARLLSDGQFPGYVIYISCPADQVDVNVHPSKHEVRFHQARWVHDYIVSTLSQTLNSEAVTESYQKVEHNYTVPYTPPTLPNESTKPSVVRESVTPQHSGYDSRQPVPYQKPYKVDALDDKQVNAYCDFVGDAYKPLIENSPENKKKWFEIVAVIKEQYALIKVINGGELLLVSMALLSQQLKKGVLFEAWSDGEVISQPLLLPVRIELDENRLQICEQFSELLTRLGFSFKKQGNKLIITKVPSLFRQAAVAKILPVLLDYLVAFEGEPSESQVADFCGFMVKQLPVLDVFSTVEVESCLAQVAEKALIEQTSLYIKPDLSLLLKGFSNE